MSVRAVRRALAVVAFAIPAGALCRAAAAQDTGVLSDSPWRWAWTPLRTVGGVGLPAPGPLRTPHLLDLPAPVVGLAWSARNPAGMSDDVRETYAQLSLVNSGIQGTYRAPLAPRRMSRLLAEYGGWRRLGNRSAVIGRAAVERGDQGEGNGAVFVLPDPSSPFVPTDTNAPATARTRVTFEGAQGVALGRWRMGISLGYSGTSDNARGSTIAVIRRAAVGGASLGLARTLGEHGRVGVSARRISRNETANVFANPATARLYLLDGFLNVNPQDYSLTSTPFLRRADRWGEGIGVDAAGRWRGIDWSTWVQRLRTGERQVSAVAANTPVQRWNTTGYDLGIASQGRLGAVMLSTVATAVVQRGTSVRSPATTREFESDASRAALHGDARWSPTGSAWGGAITVDAVRQWQRATDRGARSATDITAWSPAGGFEVSRRWRRGWSAGAGVAMGHYTPIATIPSLTARSASYLALLAPAFEVAAAPARTIGSAITIRRDGENRMVVLRAAWSSTAATQRAMDAYYLPRGSRGAWTISLSVRPHGAP